VGKTAAQETIRESVARQIRLSICEGRIKLGGKIPSERALALELRVGRPAVREALKHLEGEGLLEAIPPKGTFVRHLPENGIVSPVVAMQEENGKFLLSLTEARAVLEMWAVEHLIRYGTDEDLMKVQRAYRYMMDSVREPRELAAAPLSFHRAIAEATRKPMLPHLLESITSKWYCTNVKRVSGTVSRVEVCEICTQVHAPIMEGVLAGDVDAAIEAVETHFNQIRHCLKRYGAPCRLVALLRGG